MPPLAEMVRDGNPRKRREVCSVLGKDTGIERQDSVNSKEQCRCRK